MHAVKTVQTLQRMSEVCRCGLGKCPGVMKEYKQGIYRSMCLAFWVNVYINPVTNWVEYVTIFFKVVHVEEGSQVEGETRSLAL